MSDYQQTPAVAPAANPYMAGGATAAPVTQSPLMAQPGDNRFGVPQQQNPNDVITRSDDLGWNNSHLANQQDQLADASGAAQVGDAVRLSDGTHYQVTEEGQQLNSQFVNQIEQHFGAGQFDAMLQFASTLSQSEQASLERLVLSGNAESMTKAAQYIAQKMQGGGQSVQPSAQQGYQPQPAYQAPTQYAGGLSQQQFHTALTALEQSGYRPGQREYDAQYRELVQQRAIGKRAGR